MPSLYRYFSPSSKPYLPSPEEEKAASMAKETKVVNQEVEKTLSASGCRRRYDPEIRTKIGRFAADNGNKRAVERFSRELQRPLSESTVRGFKKAYYSELKKVKDPDKVQELLHGARGKPNKLGDLDQKVQAYIRKLRAAGTPVNRSIVIAVTAPHISVNQAYKVELKRQFTHWYAGEIEKGLRDGKEVEDVK